MESNHGYLNTNEVECHYPMTAGGAGRGNRTLVFCLEGSSSAIELLRHVELWSARRESNPPDATYKIAA